MESVVSAVGLSKRYGHITALDALQLELPKGKIVGLLGPNGSGKTTFLKLCAGVLTPNAGNVTICGEPVGVKTKALVSYLPDKTYFSRGQRIYQQLELFRDFYADFDIYRARTMLLDLDIPLNARFGSLSKGNQEKVQLVLVMARQAKLYLLDEPIGGVDPAARDYILDTILKSYNPEATVVISTHLIADVEPVLDEFVFLHNGKLVLSGDVKRVCQERGQTLDAIFREVFRCLPSC